MSHNPQMRFLVLFIAALTLACSSPDVQKRRHFERGNEYAAAKKDEFAVVEYANAVRIDPKFGEARLKLAETYERMGNLRAAFPEFIRAADALPDNRDAQIKATQILIVGGRFEDAKARTATLLTRNPKDVDALLLRADALAALKDPAAAIAEIEEALKVRPNDSRALVSLGVVRKGSGDAKDAEDAFRKAIALEPSSMNAHLAFANFLLSAGRQAEAEQELQRALSIEPQHELANRMLAALYMATNRADQAEKPLKVVAESSKSSEARFQLARYYLGVRRNEEAIKLLTELASNQATFAAAEAMRASIDYDAGRRAEAHARLDKVLARAPKDTLALVLKAQWLMNEKKPDEALDRAKEAVAANPQSAAAQFTLGAAYDLRREVPAAIAAYTEVLRLNPRVVAAEVELSRLNLASGNRDDALRYAEEAKQTQPGNVNARIALARSLLDKGELGRAETEIGELQKGLPNSAAVHILNGNLQLRRKNYTGAKTSFERALALAPGDLQALNGLLVLDVQAKQIDVAVRRVDAELKKQPDRVELLALAASVYSQAGQNDKAEQALLRAVKTDPRFSLGYSLLAQLYLQQQRLDAARTEFEDMAKRDSKAVWPRTMVGEILEAQGKRDDARRWYEATVAEMPNAPVVANNLAFMYAEQGTKLDEALQLATSAKQQMPDSPEVDDTLGWVYYKKDLASMAVGPLEESRQKRPNNASTLYHLGMTYAKLGDKVKARAALESALKVSPTFAGADSARQTLLAVSQ